MKNTEDTNKYSGNMIRYNWICSKCGTENSITSGECMCCGHRVFDSLMGWEDNVKETNPKDSAGIKKVPLSSLPAQVLMETSLALYEGSRKYGRSNYRVAGVRASVYYDALMRHIMAWWEGEDIDPDSGINHVTKAIAGLVVLRDAMLNDKWYDDRPPKVKNQMFIKEYNEKIKDIIKRYPDGKPPFIENKVTQ